MTDGHKDCDWSQYKISVLGAIDSTDRATNQIAKNVSDILREIAIIKVSLEGHLHSTKPLSRAEIEQMIQKAQEKKNGGAELSEKEVKAIVEEVVKAQQRPVNASRDPWKYILLIAIVLSRFGPEGWTEVVKLLGWQ